MSDSRPRNILYSVNGSDCAVYTPGPHTHFILSLTSFPLTPSPHILPSHPPLSHPLTPSPLTFIAVWPVSCVYTRTGEDL